MKPKQEKEVTKSRIMTKEDFRVWCKEIADTFNAAMEDMSPEEKKAFCKRIEQWGARLGGFPDEDKTRPPQGVGTGKGRP